MSASPETTTLDIEGMTCASCASFVEKSLSRTPGVQSAVVNFATEKATVQYLPDQATPATLRQAVVQAGYGVTERAPDTSAAERAAEIDQQKALAYRKLKRRFRVAVALALLVMPLSMLMLWPAMMQRVNMQWLNYGLLLLTLPALLYRAASSTCRPGTASGTGPPTWTRSLPWARARLSSTAWPPPWRPASSHATA